MVRGSADVDDVSRFTTCQTDFVRHTPHMQRLHVAKLSPLNLSMTTLVEASLADNIVLGLLS